MNAISWNKLKVFLVVFGLSVSISLIGGCGGSVPSEVNAKDEYLSSNLKMPNQFGKSLKKGTILVESFRKIDGVESEFEGVKFYEMSYEVVLQITDTAAADWRYKDASAFCFGINGKWKNDRCVKGGKFEFQKSEKGWKTQWGTTYY